MINLSASLIKDFLVCQKRAFFRINYSGKSEQTKEMALGSLVHEVLEKHWENREEALQEALRLSKEYNAENSIEKANTCINNFFDVFSTLFSKGDKIEYFFKSRFSKNIMLLGRMDRIHNHAIYDYKTSIRDPKDINSDIQFILYYVAYSKIFSRPPAGVFQVSLQTRKLHKFEPIEKNIKNLENKTIPLVYSAIDRNTFEMNGFPKACKHCSYHKICRGTNE